MTDPYQQHGYRLRFDWGPPGAAAVGPGAAVVAVVDVLSFTTALDVAVAKGITVLPYRWRDGSAAAFARRHDAVLAVGRSAVTGPDQVSLAPGTIRRATRIERLVLPSPNGSTVAHQVAGTGAVTVGVCLRNAAAAAAWVARRLSGTDGAVAVIAAGERWADGSLRPAVEDLWGAGAFLDALTVFGIGPPAPEAEVAIAGYLRAAQRLPGQLGECASGRELIAAGYPEDVAIAAEIGASTTVPVLAGDRFQAADG